MEIIDYYNNNYYYFDKKKNQSMIDFLLLSSDLHGNLREAESWNTLNWDPFLSLREGRDNFKNKYMVLFVLMKSIFFVRKLYLHI